MAAAGAPFKYLPDAETPILYSVGENGVDDGGLVWDEKNKKYDRYQHDLVFPVRSARLTIEDKSPGDDAVDVTPRGSERGVRSLRSQSIQVSLHKCR